MRLRSLFKSLTLRLSSSRLPSVSNKKNKFFINLILSLGLHSILLLSLVLSKHFFTRNNSLENPEALKLPSDIVEIAIVDNMGTSPYDSAEKVKAKSRAKNTEPKKEKAHALGLSGLSYHETFETLSDAIALQEIKDSVPLTKENYNSYSERGAHGYTNAGGIAKEYENNTFYSELWKRVRFFSGFPQDLVKYRLKGSVRIHVIVNNKGQIEGDFLKTSSENPLLELYSMAILVNALDKPLAKEYWAKDKQVPIVFQFDYNHVNDRLVEEEAKNHTGGYNANILKFSHTRYVPNEVEQYLQDFIFDNYIPLFIVLPGGHTLVDPIQIYGLIRKIVKNDTRTAKQIRKDEFSQLNIKDILRLAILNPDQNLLRKINEGRLKGSSDYIKDNTQELFLSPNKMGSEF